MRAPLLLFVLAGVSVVAGVAMIYVPAALIVLAVVLATAGVLLSEVPERGRGRQEQPR